MLGDFLNKKMLALILLIFPQVSYAEEEFHEKNKIKKVTNVETISDFFKLNQNVDRVTWYPDLGKFKRFEIIIPRRDFFIAEKFKDSSDLYYISKINKKNLEFSSKLQDKIDFILTPNHLQIVYKKPIINNLSFGPEITYNNELAIGGNISYNHIFNDLSVINLNSSIYDNGLSKLDMGIISLTDFEKSEFFLLASLYENSRSEELNIGKTWFDIRNAFDITAVLNIDNTTQNFGLYYEQEINEYQLYAGGDLNKSFNNPKMYFGISKAFGKRQNVTYNINNKNLNLKPKSLKNIRYEGLFKFWKNNIKF